MTLVMRLAATAALVWALPSLAHAQLAVSANDGKVLRPGQSAERTPDTVSIIDLSGAGPRVIGAVEAPASLVGPPASVAMAPDESFALVTAAQALDGADLVTGDTMSVIDLSAPDHPRVVQTLAAGSGATGVAINAQGTLALVASTGSDKISVFSISEGRLTPAGEVRLNYQSRPTDVAFSPDGKTALVVTQSANRIVRLAVDGATVTRTDVSVAPGQSPYGVLFGRGGHYAYVTNSAGALAAPGSPPPTGPRTGSVAVLDLETNTLVGGVDVGVGPEHLTLSADGSHLAVVLVNGSGAPETSPAYNPFGLLRVYRVNGPTLQLAAETRTGPWCQGAAWSGAGRLLVQCALAGEIEVYDFDGANLERDQGATLTFTGRPAAISVAAGR